MTTKWLWPRKLRTTIPSVPHASCHSTPFPDLSPSPFPALPTNAWTCPACDTARGWLGIGPRSVWSGSEELPTPARPQSPPRGPPARPRAPRPHPGREPPVESRNRRARARRGPARESRQASPGKASERGGAGGRCQRGVGAGPKQNWATHQEESSVRTRCSAAPLLASAVAGGVTSGQRPCAGRAPRRAAEVVPGHGLTPARGRTRPHARGGHGERGQPPG